MPKGKKGKKGRKKPVEPEDGDGEDTVSGGQLAD
jgi:hypothetical protein